MSFLNLITRKVKFVYKPVVLNKIPDFNRLRLITNRFYSSSKFWLFAYVLDILSVYFPSHLNN